LYFVTKLSGVFVRFFVRYSNSASNNTILNCDSYFNADAALENADGFA
jgi:hypothetical protein